MKIAYLFLAALFSSLIFCNNPQTIADNSARDEQTGDCIRQGRCKD